MIIIENEKVLIDKDGFISASDINDATRSFVADYLIDLMEKINRYVYELYDAVDVKSHDMTGLFFISLLSEIHKDYQAAIILSSRGLLVQSKELVRGILEKVFIIKAVANDDKNLKRWYDSQEFQRYRLLKDAYLKKPGLDSLSYIAETSPEKKGENVHISEWAKLAGMDENYNREYRLLSEAVHFSMANYIDGFDFNGEIPEAIIIGPIYEDVDAVMLTALEYLAIAVGIVNYYFGTECNDWNNLKEAIDLCWKKLYLSKA